MPFPLWPLVLPSHAWRDHRGSCRDRQEFDSMSAVLQQGLDLLWQQHADAKADRAALRALLAERAGGPFVTSGERLA
jgi:Arc/MetJ-type ribon-helix-helix transcriptional regulator